MGKFATPQSEAPLLIQAQTMDELWDRLNKRILWAKKPELAYYSSLDTMMTDVMGTAQVAKYDLNIGKDLWLTPSRWSTLIRQYVDPIRLFQWLEGVKYISTYNRGIVAMDMNPVQQTVVASNPRANRRKWGGCMRMVTYRAFPRPTVTLFSRTSYLGYIGGLDMMLAYKLIEVAADMIGDGLKPEEFSFRWVLDTIQFHGFKSMAYLFASGQDKLMRARVWPEDRLGPEDDYPTWKLVRSWWKRLHKQDQEGKMYSEMKYGAEIRIRRRYHAQVTGDTSFTDLKFKPQPILDHPMDTLTLDKMIYSTPESRAVIARKKKEKAEKMIRDLFGDEGDYASVLELGRRNKDKFVIVKNPQDIDSLLEGVV